MPFIVVVMTPMYSSYVFQALSSKMDSKRKPILTNLLFLSVMSMHIDAIAEESTWDKTKANTKETWGDVKEGAKEAGTGIKGAAKSAWQWVKDIFN